MPLLLRLFFIRRSKNNRRRSHAGSEGRTVFQKNRRARLSGAWACPDEGLLQRNWRACVQKNSGSVRAPWPYARRRTKTRLPRGLAGTLWNGRFSTTGCALDVEDFRKTRPAGGHKRMRQRQCSVIQKNSTPSCRPARGLRIQIRSSRSSPGKGNHEK